MQDQSTPPRGTNWGLIVWGYVLTFFLGLIGLAIVVFGEHRKRGDRIKGAVLAIVTYVVLAVVIIAAASSGSKKSTYYIGPAGRTSETSSTSKTYKFSATKLSCSNDATNTRVCTGQVTNISPKAITDAMPIVHWTGGADSDLGTIDINPILPGQTAKFTVFTLSANPAINNYRLGFKKVFGDESDFPVQP